MTVCTKVGKRVAGTAAILAEQSAWQKVDKMDNETEAMKVPWMADWMAELRDSPMVCMSLNRIIWKVLMKARMLFDEMDGCSAVSRDRYLACSWVPLLTIKEYRSE